VVILLLFMAGPIIWAVYGSFTNTALTGSNARNPAWIGLDNYIKLFGDPTFFQSLRLTVLFVFASAVVGQNVLGLGLALAMARAGKAVRAIAGTIVVTAWVLPELVAAFAAYAYFTGNGTLNQMLGALGVSGRNWLFDFPMATVILANVWRGTAFSMLVYQAALRSVPPELTEAASLDGAGTRQSLLYVTLPVIRSSIATNLMLTTLQTLSVFTLILVMTSGGPGFKSSTLPVFAYQEAFKFGDIGYGTAIATVMLLIGAVFAVAYIRLLGLERERT